MREDKINNCRICGFDHGSPTWEHDGCAPTYDICDCCGAEFGYEDCTPQTAKAYRDTWIAQGARWFGERAKPTGWTLSEQLKGIPDGFA